MKEVRHTVLTPASSGFDAWQWTEFAVLEDAEDLLDFESVLSDQGVFWTVTNELDGKIHNQHGRVYRVDQPTDEDQERYGPRYFMAWEHED